MRFFSWIRRAPQKALPQTTPTGSLVEAGGRTYLADTLYALPKDLGETNRLNFQHFLLRQLMQGNFRAPLHDPRDILDVGCGTGRWAIEMGTLFPRCNVFGLDKLPPQQLSLGYGITEPPPNVVFLQGDVLQTLPFPDRSFDLVFMRLLYSAIPATRWPFVINELVRVTRSGGWVEMIEGGLPPAGGPAMNMLHTLTIEGGNKVGLDMTVGSRLTAYLRDAGLSAVRGEELPVPLGSYGGRIGKLMGLDLYEILKAGRGLSVARGIASAEDYDRALQNWPQEIERVQSTFSFFHALGQRA